MIRSLTQGHRLPMVAPAAILGGVGRVHSDEHSASFFRFARELLKELRPCRVTDAFRKAMIMNHLLDMQIFHTDDPELVHDFATVLMGEVLASPCNTFMNPRDHPTMLAPFFRALCQSGMLALDFCQGRLLLTKETGIVNFFARRKRRKGLESYINAHLSRFFCKTFRFTHDGKADVPFVGRGASNGTGLDGAFDGTVRDHFHGANLREADTVVVGDAESRLRIGDAIIAPVALKARVSRFLARFAPTKERFIGQIDTDRHVLKDLRMHIIQRWTFLLQDRIGSLLLETRKGETVTLIGGRAHLEQVVIEASAFFQVRFQDLQLFLRRIDPVLIRFKHGVYSRFKPSHCQGVLFPLRHRKEKPFIPMPRRLALIHKSDEFIMEVAHQALSHC
jgi:hypothetical protein